MNPKNLNQALNLIYNKLDEFDFVQIAGVSNNLKINSEYNIATGYKNGKIILKLMDENLKILDIITDMAKEDVKIKIKRIIRCYQLQIMSIVFNIDKSKKNITECSFDNQNLLYSISSIPQENNHLHVSYKLGEGKIDYLELFKAYNNFLDMLNQSNSKPNIQELSINPICLVRKQKIIDIEFD